MSKTKLLVIDDEPDICELLSLTLSRMGYSCDLAHTYQQAIDKLNANTYALVLTDMRLPDGDGIELVKYIQKTKNQLPVAVITAYGNVEGAVNTLKAGAFDYLSKPVDLKQLKDLVNTALAMQETKFPSKDDVLLGKSPIMQELRQNINKLARNQAPVFILGESGVGKELVAQLIHRQGPRADKPFIPVNCGAIPSELMESEFFGHKKGSFTGAITDKSGLFVAANGGTLFLDEIAELSLSMQVKLLRAIQEKAIKPIGEYTEIPVDVRLLSASHKNLQDEIVAGRFRQDLYYRVNVIELRVPTLRERLTDIPILSDYILDNLGRKHGRTILPLSRDCIQKLQAYHFPGNVRELENILERAVAMCEGDIVTVKDIQIPQTAPALSSVPQQQINANLNDSLYEHEKELILNALEKTKWNRTAAAKILGISFRTLRYRLKKLGLD
ncbi:two-component system response regulator PilR [Legionella busanensis]|uniref:Two-component system response regulator PilR n=1 Tax=Legionella busanensis TaxID=190655 RepID=A0A378JIH8_9GAMM|nr:sigma-54 dependent transcriptional regulator [Legionella busanensis]STX51116.1 two-component system response regulator PilR [Legionella busanensis]